MKGTLHKAIASTGRRILRDFAASTGVGAVLVEELERASAQEPGESPAQARARLETHRALEAERAENEHLSREQLRRQVSDLIQQNAELSERIQNGRAVQVDLLTQLDEAKQAAEVAAEKAKYLSRLALYLTEQSPQKCERAALLDAETRADDSDADNVRARLAAARAFASRLETERAILVSMESEESHRIQALERRLQWLEAERQRMSPETAERVKAWNGDESK